MSTVQPTDKTLVNRAGVDHSAPADMSTVQDTDLLLINRAGVDYKCTFLDWKNSQSKAPDVGAVTLADVAGGSRFTSVSFPVSATMTENGIPASTKKLKAYVEGTLKSAAQTSAIASVAGNVLTITDNTQLANFTAGDAITEVTSTGTAGDATGTVGAVDAVAKTITLATTAGTWDVGSAVKGPLKAQMVTVTPNSDVITAVTTGAPANVILEYRGFSLLSDPNSIQPTIYASASVFSAGANIGSVMAGQIPAGAEIYQYIGVKLPSKGKVSWGHTNPSSVGSGDTVTLWGSNDGTNWIKDSTGSVSKTRHNSAGNYLYFLASRNGDGVPGSMPTVGQTVSSWHYFASTDPVTTITFATAKDLAKFAAGDAVHQDSGGPASGVVDFADPTAKTMTLATSTGTWGPANTGKYVIGPSKTGPAANVKLYCKFDAAGAVSDLQSADPGFTAWTPAGTGPYTGNVTFPATLPSGAAPDTDLPAGTTITVEVQATNTSGSDSAKSNVLTPA